MPLSTAETYCAAAKEHLERAFFLHESEQYFLAHYTAGLAVECHLRAYLTLITDQFDARHDPRVLAKESNFYRIVPRGQEEAFSADFDTLNLR